MQNKKGAIELSIGTIVIIVLAMSMLILGIILVRNIFKGSTNSVDELNSKVRSEIRTLFSTNKDSDIIVLLGSDKTARIEQGTEKFGIAFGARTFDGSSANSRNRMQYTLSLDENGDCIKKIGRKKVEGFFKTSLDVPQSFDKFDGPRLLALILLRIPDGTAICTQKVFIDVEDKENPGEAKGSFFIIEITKKGFF